MAYTMYDTLLQIPPFQGMSRSELSTIIEKVKFNFMKFADKEVIFRQGERCDNLSFLISGQIASKTIAPCGRFRFEEFYNQPMIIEPHSLFGKNPSYKSSYIAEGETALLTIDKRYFYSVLDCYEVFRMNFFNMLSNRAEHLYSHIWSITPQELEGRLIHFIRGLCTNLQGTKILYIKMEDLAQLLDDTRLNVSNVLNKWQEEGLIEMRRKEFVFLDVENLRAI
jgi:CRP-like cAMP-binding protein